jgi:hypothetical protein
MLHELHFKREFYDGSIIESKIRENLSIMLLVKTKIKEEVVTVAIRDIEIGEEVLDNYNSFEDERSENDVLDEIAERFQLKDELDPRFKKVVVP